MSASEQHIPAPMEPISAVLLDPALPRSQAISNDAPATVRAGLVLTQEGVLLPDGFLMDSDSYTPGWRSVRTINSFGVDQKIRSAGWNMFTIAGEYKTTAWGSATSGHRRALIRALVMIGERRFNSAVVTSISKGHFLGIPYTSVRVQARHIQQSYMLDGPRSRAQSQRDTARG